MTTHKYAQRLASLTAQQRALLFQQLKEQQSKEQATHTALVARDRDKPDYPLSFAQQRLWFLDQLEPGSPLYTIPQIFHLRGPLPVGALRRAVEALIARHETLRTTFVTIDGVPRQRVAPQGACHVTLIDLDLDASLDARRELARELAYAEVGRPFTLATGPLFRVTVLRLNEQESLLLLLIHHIISDAWSSSILLQELFTLMKSFAQGHSAQLPPLPVQYVDFALWQQAQLQGRRLEQLLAYWKAQLAHIPLLQLPFDHARPAEQTFSGAVASRSLAAELTARLRTLARQEDCTLFMTLLAVFAALLYRYTGQEDITVGTLIANRTREEIEGLIGFFVNTLVLHTRLEGPLAFRELLARVRQICLDAYAHQDLPFERLVDELQPERSLSHSPLFQVLFCLQNTPETREVLGDLELTAIDLGPPVAKFDLSCYVVEHPADLNITIEYNTGLFEATTIQRLLDHFQALLAACVVDPRGRVDALPLLRRDERQALLSASNATARAYPAQHCLSRLFEQQVAATPEAIALVFEDQAMTFQELNTRANQLARYLQQTWSIGPEVTVGLCVERCPEMVIGLLGILKAGGAYVPLDPDYPQARLMTILTDAQARLVLTQARLRVRIAQAADSVLCLDEDWPLVSRMPGRDLPAEAHPANLAYLIYTSGSTGRPKGVQITHQALVNFLTSMGELPGLAAEDTLLAVTSISFDIAGLEIYLPLLRGSRLVIASRSLARDGEQLIQALKRYGVTTMQATPSTWRMLLEAGWRGAPHMRILCGGEALPADLGQRLLEKGQSLWNLYGPTETTIWSTIYRVETVDGAVPLGYPIANTQTYVLDARLEPVPPGVVGELYIGGDGLSRGYFKQAALTAERFLPDPFASRAGMRLYRTGDLACYRADGALRFLSRVDHQVKIQGFRIELQEIEQALNRHPGVYESVVNAYEARPGERSLVAYIVADSGHAEEYLETDSPQERVSHWLTVWDTIYTAGTARSDPTFNLSGWQSSYTQQPIPEEEMREWVNTTVERLRTLRAERVLEIGCGTGLLLFQLAPHCTRYCATDFSPEVLAQVRQQAERLNLAGVSLLQREASDFTGIGQEAYDLVILNSVAQYFPDAGYLWRVLEGALQVVKPGGIVFLGDLRSLPLLHAFHASVQLHQAARTTARADLLQLVRTRASQEEELLIDPELFADLPQALPQVGHVEIQLRRGQHANELTRFRYDALLHKRAAKEPAAPVEPLLIDWQRERASLTSLRQLLREAAPRALFISGVPNARVLEAVKAYELLEASAGPENAGALREALNELEQQHPGIDPEEFWQLSATFPYSVSVAWSRTHGPGYYDVMLRRNDLATVRLAFPTPGQPRLPASTYTNTPLRKFVPQRLAPALRAHLKSHLPEYMHPAAFVFLPALPLTPNRKIDRRALPAPGHTRPGLKEAYVMPRSRTEKLLAEIWAQTLEIEQVGIYDNFFELGGNSLLVIRLVARATKAGLPITAKQIFLHQTVAQLAQVIGTEQIVSEQGPGAGPAPATPGQCAVLAGDVRHPEFFNLAYFIFAQPGFEIRPLRRVLQALIVYHDALRICRAPAGSAWPLVLKEPPAEFPCAHIDLSRLSEAEVTTVARQFLNVLQTSLDLDQGPLFQAALFDCGPDRPSILLLLAHYLVADIEAWQILLEDVTSTYQQLIETGDIRLPARSTSFRQWAVRLRAYAESDALEKELPYWLDEARRRVQPLPLDYPQGRNVIGSSRTIETELTEEETGELLSNTLRRYHTQMDVLLITAISLACLTWSKQEALLINLFSHGREPLFEDVDVSRTVGTFGTDFPVLISLPASTPIQQAIHEVHTLLTRVPRHGIGYGILRHLSQSEQARCLRSLPEAEIVVNYIGETFHEPGQSRFTVFGPYTGHHHDQETERGYKLQITGQVLEGKLQLRWDYSQNLHASTTIESLAHYALAMIRAMIDISPP